jgi:hypothetical protein
MTTIPQVDDHADFAEVVRKARQLCDAATEVPGREPGERGIALITPGRMVMLLPVPSTTPTSEMIAGVRKFVPEEPPLQVTVIGNTDIVSTGSPDLRGVNRLIPFTGYLLGIGYLGHNVIIFEGHPSVLAEGCRDADLLIVDEPSADAMQPDWAKVASRAMRRPRILIFLRNGQVGVVNPDTEQWGAGREPSLPPPGPKPKKKPWWWPF